MYLSDCEPIAEDKYVRRCTSQKAQNFILKNSFSNIQKTGCVISIKVWICLSIKFENAQSIFDTVRNISSLEIDVDWDLFIQEIENLSEEISGTEI